MGIKNLYNLTTNNIVLANLFTTINSPNIFKGICVDASYILYNIACKIYNTNNNQLDPNRNFFKYNFLYFLSNLTHQNSNQLWIFDGYNPKKEFIRESRNKSQLNTIMSFVEKKLNSKNFQIINWGKEHPIINVIYNDTTYQYNNPYPTNLDIEIMKRILFISGIPIIQANNIEAEQLCVVVCKTNDNYDAVLSNDTDVLMCNGTLLVLCKNEYKYLTTATILTTFNINYNEFVKICIHLGCDFCEKTKSIGPKLILNKHKLLQLSPNQLCVYNDIMALPQFSNITIINGQFNLQKIIATTYDIDVYYVKIPPGKYTINHLPIKKITIDDQIVITEFTCSEFTYSNPNNTCSSIHYYY